MISVFTDMHVLTMLMLLSYGAMKQHLSHMYSITAKVIVQRLRTWLFGAEKFAVSANMVGTV